MQSQYKYNPEDELRLPWRVTALRMAGTNTSFCSQGTNDTNRWNQFDFILRLPSHAQEWVSAGHMESDSDQQHELRDIYWLESDKRVVWLNSFTTLEGTRDSKCDRSVQVAKCTYSESQGVAVLLTEPANGPLGQAGFHKCTARIIFKAVKYAAGLMAGSADLWVILLHFF